MLTLGKQPLASPRISTVHTSGSQWRPNSPSRQAVRLHHLDHLSRAFACNRGLLCFTMMPFCTSPRQPKQRWQLSFFQLRHLTSPHLTANKPASPSWTGTEPARDGDLGPWKRQDRYFLPLGTICAQMSLVQWSAEENQQSLARVLWI